MKKALLMLVMISFASCQNEEVDTSSKQTEASFQDESHVCSTLDALPSESNPTGRVSLKGSYWTAGETIRIKFLNGDAFLQNKVKQFASQWVGYANLKFLWVKSNEQADIKIGFKFNGDAGSWSLIGTGCRSTLQNVPSMNYGWFDSNTSDTEFSRIILHEFGHALGLLHEMSNPGNKIQWNKAYLFAQLGEDAVKYLVTYDGVLADYTNYDDKSIMMYSFPPEYTLNGYSVPWNIILSSEDKASIKMMYPFPVISQAKAHLGSGESLKNGESLTTSDKRYLLIMQADGNLVIYDKINGGNKAIWATGTNGRTGVTATMQGDGNLVLYQNGAPIWHSATYGIAGATLTLQDDGNLVIYKADVPLWSSKFGLTGNKSVLKPGESLLAAQTLSSTDKKYILAMQVDGNLVVYNLQGQGYKAIWSTATNGRKGVVAVMQSDGNFVLYQNTTPIWATVTNGRIGTSITMQTDGNLVLYQNKVALWSSKYGRTGR